MSFQISKFSNSLAFLETPAQTNGLLWPKTMCQRYQAGRESRKQEHELLKTELIVDHDEKHNAQKNEEDEAAIKNNDGSVDKPEGEIKEVNIKVVVNSYS